MLTLFVPARAQKKNGSSKKEKKGQDPGLNTVVIDPGHGGKDPGAIGHSDTHEKNIVLDIGLKLGKLIKDHYGDKVEVIYTRKTDKFVELHERSRIAKENNADLFISLHANVVGNSNVHGCETFVLGLHRSKANLEVAKKENSAILMEEDHERHYGDFDPRDPDSYIALELMQSEFLKQSLQFAAQAQKQFDNKVGRNNRGVKQAGFLVLYRTTMPSVLMEMGFISNPEEEAFLTSDKGKKKMASAIYRAFKGYKERIDERNSFDASQDSLLASQPKDRDTSSTDPKKKDRTGKETKSQEEKGVRFKVQIAASKRAKELKPENFKGLSNVDAYISEDGIHKYTVGNTRSYEKAEKIESKVKDSGYPGAFIIAFKDGERIETKKAKDLAKRSEDR
ncbi:MAG: N-acetylmuramoyl-L-alanine amidase [Flavobacteriales bacterium]